MIYVFHSHQGPKVSLVAQLTGKAGWPGSARMTWLHSGRGLAGLGLAATGSAHRWCASTFQSAREGAAAQLGHGTWRGCQGDPGDRPGSTCSQRATLSHGTLARHDLELKLTLKRGGSMRGRFTGGCGARLRRGRASVNEMLRRRYGEVLLYGELIRGFQMRQGGG
jgi:hypothetical protein